MNGAQVFLQVLSESGIEFLFGNPGTTELPLNEALIDTPAIRYVLGLHEIPVMAMADGFSQVSGKPSVVNLHACCGLGNAMGMMFNSYRSGTPLVVTAGQQDTRMQSSEPALWTDLVRFAEPCTKWAHEIRRTADIPQAVSRALQIAQTPPCGPVFLSLPIDVMDEEWQGSLELPSVPFDSAVRPPVSAIQSAAEMLATSQNPCLVVGSRVADQDAVHEVVQLAEAIGAPVMSEPRTARGRLSFPASHDLLAAGLPLWSPDIRERLSPFDVVVVVGCDLFRLYIYCGPESPLPTSSKLIHIDCNASEIAKNYRTDVGVVGNIRAVAGELATAIQNEQTASAREAVRSRRKTWAQSHQESRSALAERASDERNLPNITQLGLVQFLSEILPSDAIIVDEAATADVSVMQQLGGIERPENYFAHRGWCLGWGLGAALGAQLASPDRPVILLVGDGAFQYGLQGLWTASHYGIPIKILVCNNHGYAILKHSAQKLELKHALEDRFEGMDLRDPEVDPVAIAQAYAIEGQRIDTFSDLENCLPDILAADQPRLLDIRVQR